jgi:hypothetical protein
MHPTADTLPVIKPRRAARRVMRGVRFLLVEEIQVSHWRRITYSVSLAVIVTALSVFFIERGGLLLLFPGFMLEMMFGWIIVADPEVFLLTEHAWGGNVAAYSCLLYVCSWAFIGI